jgi:hypothetical protein
MKDIPWVRGTTLSDRINQKTFKNSKNSWSFGIFLPVKDSYSTSIPRFLIPIEFEKYQKTSSKFPEISFPSHSFSVLSKVICRLFSFPQNLSMPWLLFVGKSRRTVFDFFLNLCLLLVLVVAMSPWPKAGTDKWAFEICWLYI